MIKDYVSKNSLAEFLAKIRENFSAKDHIHTKSDIADYVEVTVDTEMSSDSTNPVQNKIIKEKFDSISDQVSALANDAILSVEQHLSEEQKVQARKNIGVDSGESIVIKPNINGFFRENGAISTSTNYLRTDYIPLAGYNRIEYNVFVVSGSSMATWTIFDENKSKLASSGEVNGDAYYTVTPFGSIMTYGHMCNTLRVDDLLIQYPTAAYIAFSTNVNATYQSVTGQSGVDVGWGAMEQYAKFIQDDEYGAVRYDLEQELSVEQMLLARQNIGIDNVSFNFNKRKYVEEFKTDSNGWDDAFSALIQYCTENNYTACATGTYALANPLVIGDIDVDFEHASITNNTTTEACIILTGAEHRVQKFGTIICREGIGILVNGDSKVYAYNKLYANYVCGYINALAVIPTNNHCWFNEYHMLRLKSSQIPLRMYTVDRTSALINESYLYLGMLAEYRDTKPIKLIEMTCMERCNVYNLNIEQPIADPVNGAAVELTNCYHVAFFNPRIAEPYNDVQFRFIGKCFGNYIDTEYCKYATIDSSQMKMSDLHYNVVRGAVITGNNGSSTNCNTLRVYKDMVVPVTLTSMPVNVTNNIELDPSILLQYDHDTGGESVFGIPTLYKWASGNITINRRFIALLIPKLQIMKVSDSIGNIIDEDGNLIVAGSDLELNKRYDINVVSKEYAYDTTGEEDDATFKYLSNIVLSIDKADCDDAVLYTEQTLTEDQKTQVRINIGAATSNMATIECPGLMSAEDKVALNDMGELYYSIANIDYDSLLSFDTSEVIVGNESSSTTSMLGKAILGRMILG